MLTEEDRALVLSVWAALVSAVAICFLIGSFWKATLIGAFVGGTSLLGYKTKWVLNGAFAVAVLAIAVALGLPPPDEWLRLIHQVQQAVVAYRTGA
jgi:ABC-type proline/glycine betaine transport system permease subunit